MPLPAGASPAKQELPNVSRGRSDLRQSNLSRKSWYREKRAEDIDQHGGVNRKNLLYALQRLEATGARIKPRIAQLSDLCLDVFNPIVERAQHNKYIDHFVQMKNRRFVGMFHVLTINTAYLVLRSPPTPWSESIAGDTLKLQPAGCKAVQHLPRLRSKAPSDALASHAMFGAFHASFMPHLWVQ